MGHYEDFFWEVHEELDKLGLRDKFDAQLKKMQRQDKHQFKEARQKWEYARDKIISEFQENKICQNKKNY